MRKWEIHITLLDHNNDSHECHILAADLLWDIKWTAYLYPSLTSRPCLDGLSIFYPIIENNKVNCEYGTLMWIIAVVRGKYYIFFVPYLLRFIFYWEQCFSGNKISGCPVVVSVIQLVLYYNLCKVIFFRSFCKFILFVHKQYSKLRKIQF